MIALMLAALAPHFLRPTPFMETFLKIRSVTDEEIPFTLNPLQRKLAEIRRKTRAAGKKPRFIVLKARKGGITTYVQGLCVWRVCTRENAQAVTLGPEDEGTEKIFEVADRFYGSMDPRVRPARLTEHNKRTLDFPGLRSSYYVGTAGKKAFARGSTITIYHGTEVAFWPGKMAAQDNLLAGLDVAAEYGEGWLESTANGYGNLFHALWEDAKAGSGPWVPIFLPWWFDTKYRIPLTRDQGAELLNGLSDEEKELSRLHRLTLEQVAWRRAKQKERKRLFVQEYPEDDVTCFILTGTCFFDREKIQAARLRAAGKPPIAWKKFDDAGISDLRVWKEPRRGHRYAAGGDVAEGTPDGNFSVLGIVDIDTMEQVACLRGKWKPEEFGRRSAALSSHYNEALLGLERNNHGHSALNTLANTLEYPNLYYHTEYDSSSGGRHRVLGWPTTPKTRPIMLDRFRDAVEDGETDAVDEVMLSECMTFVSRSTDGGARKYMAADGTKDDSIFGWAVAFMMREAALAGDGGDLPEGHDTVEAVRAAERRSMFLKPSGGLFNGT